VDAYLAIASKREVRAYADRRTRRCGPGLLEAGRVAGSSRNRQTRRFVVLRDDALERAAGTVYAQGNLSGQRWRWPSSCAARADRLRRRARGAEHDARRLQRRDRLVPNGVADAAALAAISATARTSRWRRC